MAATEARLVDAATRLFVRNGYVATTLTAVAEEAGVAPRTVYLRFGTKVALFARVMDVAVVGDTAPVDLEHRPTTQRAFTAPTLGERVHVVHNWGWEPVTVTLPTPMVDLLVEDSTERLDALQLGPWDVRVLVEALP